MLTFTPSRYSNQARLAGFSLIELMVVVAVLGILTAFALPSYSVWMENTRIRNAAESIQAGLQIARLEAIKRNVRVQFRLGDDLTSTWTVGCVTVVAGTCPATIASHSGGEGGAAHIKVVAAPAGATTVVFSSFGTVVQAAAGALAAAQALTQVDVDSSAFTATDRRELRIKIGAGGGSRMCDPDTGLANNDARRCDPPVVIP